ncbi:hypothetical protein PLICRDRAFT_28800 [Plicaturopsis crispa FD-325 SS-3]|nr:hypothetical protein PLICRDRAFT_28800 [Plicaturopsis crispa FD-325 SS-3]
MNPFNAGPRSPASVHNKAALGVDVDLPSPSSGDAHMAAARPHKLPCPPRPADILRSLYKRVSKELSEAKEGLRAQDLRCKEKMDLLESYFSQEMLRVKEDFRLKESQYEERVRVLEGYISRTVDALKCPVCVETMRWPTSLYECGHTFCEPCISQWFETRLVAFLQDNGATTLEWAPPFNADALHAVLERLQLKVPRNLYDCPCCRAQVYRKPVSTCVATKVSTDILQRVDDAAGDINGWRDERLSSLSDLFALWEWRVRRMGAKRATVR